jgi:subtilase family serine protease
MNLGFPAMKQVGLQYGNTKVSQEIFSVWRKSVKQFGGLSTSLSCPLWAGFMADVNQIRVSHGYNAAGFVNPFLYKSVYGVSGTSSHYASDFHDITVGSNGWAAGKGWDAATGLGSFKAANLASTLGNAKGA